MKLLSGSGYVVGFIAGIFTFVPYVLKKLNRTKREKEHRRTVAFLIGTIGVLSAAIAAFWVVFVTAVKKFEKTIFDKEDFEIIDSETADEIEHIIKKQLCCDDDTPVSSDRINRIPLDTEATEENLG